MALQHFDVLIVGAGLSGIGTACHIQQAFPDKSLAILERRKNLGGTWDLFRYPGIRSDSDMFSFGYQFRPWNELKVLADGPAIRQYITDTAKEFQVDKKIHYGLKILQANWSGSERRWILDAIDESSGEKKQYSCDFFISCTGYYNHDAGYLPSFPGEEQFQGIKVHPQHWPEDLDYSGKKVVIIGSGATAVTLVPAMADKAAHVTMLQRSPSYIFSVPAYDKLSAILRRVLPESLVYRLARKRNITIQRLIYKVSKRWPGLARFRLLSGVRKQLGKGVDMRHFTPSYQPWDERICAVPDADLFEVLKAGKASVVTDTIKTFTRDGIALESGQELKADIIVTATGLNLQTCGGMDLLVDGEPRQLSKLMTYKGALLQDIPNMSFVFGYTNAPWTLKVDLTAHYLCRLFRYMRSHNLQVVTPRAPAGEMQEHETVLGSLQSGYIKRGESILPRQGRSLPWRVLHDFERDRDMLLHAPLEDTALEFQAHADAPRHGVSPEKRFSVGA